jgi:hypothetical protein
MLNPHGETMPMQTPPGRPGPPKPDLQAIQRQFQTIFQALQQLERKHRQNMITQQQMEADLAPLGGFITALQGLVGSLSTAYTNSQATAASLQTQLTAALAANNQPPPPPVDFTADDTEIQQDVAAVQAAEATVNAVLPAPVAPTPTPAPVSPTPPSS